MGTDLTSNDKTGLYVDEAGQFTATIKNAIYAQNAKHEDGTEVTFETDEGKQIKAFYNQQFEWKLNKLALAAQLTTEQRKDFEPDMLIGKQVLITITEYQKRSGDMGYTVYEAFAVNGDKPIPPATKPSTNANDDVPF